MNFKKAYSIAMSESDYFRHFNRKVETALSVGEKTPCLIFSIYGECFYYGFDGVEIQLGKHNTKRSSELIKANQTLIIL